MFWNLRLRISHDLRSYSFFFLHMHVLLILQLSIFVLQAATTQAQNPSPYPVTCERTSGNSALHKKTRATIDSGRKQPNARSNFLALNSEFFRIQRCPSIPFFFKKKESHTGNHIADHTFLWPHKKTKALLSNHACLFSRATLLLFLCHLLYSGSDG